MEFSTNIQRSSNRLRFNCLPGMKFLHSAFEIVVIKIHLSGGNIDLKIIQKNSIEHFLDPMYDVLKKLVVLFVTEINLPLVY